MIKPVLTKTFERRGFLRLSGGVAALAVTQFLPFSARADRAAVAKAMKAVLGERKPATGKVTIDLPEIAEDGSSVQMTIAVESPMTETNFVKTVHVFAEGNPRPNVASFHFTPLSGEARVTTRIRLAKTQNIVALAEMSDGSVFVAKRSIKVTVGGCGDS
ncbi:MAG: thiosulfate oxidation carrier protein SoxY [Alphaproteobacteria bacterium]|nr:thiosulfate oxidation carrier protein SoxY [Alphaproteobacteria bacterium]